MYILDVMETCNSAFLSGLLPVVKNIILLIQIIAPIALLIAFTVDFVKLSVNPEEKDAFRKLLNKIIAAVIIFMIPVLINLIMGAVGESTEFSNCWNNAGDILHPTGEDEYVEIEEENFGGAYSKPEESKTKNTGTNSTGTNNNTGSNNTGTNGTSGLDLSNKR